MNLSEAVLLLRTMDRGGKQWKRINMPVALIDLWLTKSDVDHGGK